MSQDKLTSDCSDGYHCDTPPQSANFDDINEDTKLIRSSDVSYHNTVTSSTDPLTNYDTISEGNPFEHDQDLANENELESPFIGQEDEQSRDQNYDVGYVRDVTNVHNNTNNVSQFEASHRAARSCELLHQGPTFSVEALSHHASKSCEILNQPTTHHACPSEEPLGQGIMMEEFWPQATSEAWRIEDCGFESFSEVCERASLWLRDRPDLRLLNCETAEKKVTNIEDIYTDQLIYTDKGCTPILVKGLRLWLSPEASKTNNMSMLRFVDIIPQCTSPGNQDIVTLADFYDDLEDAGHGKPQYETLGDALDRYNASLTHTPLKGRIVTVETVNLTISRDRWDGNLDPQGCRWADRWLRDRFFFLRVFYLTGPPAHERIGLADFVPDQEKDVNPLSLRTCLSRFDALVDQARDWLNTIQGIRVTNVQTVDTKFARSVEFPSISNKEHVAEKLQTQQSYEYSIETRPRALFLRVAYVLPTEGMDGPVEWPLPMLNCQTFEPAYVNVTTQSGDSVVQLEGLNSLTNHVSAWLVRKGARPFCAQVLTVPQGYNEKTDINQRTLYCGEYEDGYERVERLNCIQMVRVFMDGPSEIALTEDGTLSADDIGDNTDEYDTLNEPSCCALQ